MMTALRNLWLLNRNIMTLPVRFMRTRESSLDSSLRRVLHVIPRSATQRELYFHGSTKDIRCRTEYFRSRDIELQELIVDRDEDAIIRALGDQKLGDFEFIVVDIPGSFPLALRYVRSHAPRPRLLFRSHNAEFFHRMDWMRAARGLVNKSRYARRAMAMLLRDVNLVFSVDGIMAISDWDATHYWGRLPFGRKVLSVPYFLPREYRQESFENAPKRDLCVCLGSTSGNPLIADSNRNFCSLVGELGDRAPGWEFSITGDTGDLEGLPRRVQATGLLDSPYEILTSARAVALLSDRGRGFKTKILEAIHARAFVLVTPGLYRRLPEEVLPFCISVKRNSAVEFLDALERCSDPFPSNPVNELLRSRAFEAMDRMLGLKSRKETVPATVKKP